MRDVLLQIRALPTPAVAESREPSAESCRSESRAPRATLPGAVTETRSDAGAASPPRGGPPTGDLTPKGAAGVTERLLRGAEALPARAGGGLRAAARFAPTRRLALAVAVTAPLWLFSGFTLGAWFAGTVTALLALAAVADIVRAPAASDLAVERALPGELGLGDTVSGAYRVRSLWHRPLAVELHDALPDAVAAEDDARAAVVPAGEQVELPLTLAGRRRGRYALGPVAVRVAGPLGLVSRTLRWALDDVITVAPSLAGVRRYRLLALQHRLRDLGVRTLRRRGEGTTFASLREYAVGDDPRHIDWKATARRRKPITREYTVEQGQTVMIAVDAGRLMTQLADAGPGARSRFEYALASALVLADVALHSGDQVGVLLFDDEVRAFVPPARGRSALRGIHGALVAAQATMAEPDYAAAFRTLATRHRKRSLIVLLTDVVDARSSQALVALTTLGAVRHLPLVVALRNDALVRAALPAGRHAPDALFESAAAEELLSARHEALARMRQAGVAVVDTSPRAMTAAVVNRYLEVKNRGEL